MHIAIKVLPALLMLSFIGCRETKTDTAILKELTKRFPQLGTGEQLRTYLTRRVITGQDQTQIALYKVFDTANDEQQVFIIKNSEEQSYAFPFFSNTFTGYWDFQTGNPAMKLKASGDNFEQEFNACLKALNIKNAESYRLINEIMLSALHCKVIERSDSMQLNSLCLSYNDHLPQEDDSSCYQRIRGNWRSLSKELFNDEQFVPKIAYWDKENCRVYLFDLTGIKNKLPFYFRIKVFSEDCVAHILQL